jgi:YVTN family beta-propeller protein
VKPGNVLLDSRDRAYLTDFGLIRRTQLQTDITKTGQFMGTVDYCAPEQIKGGEIDARVDVYSLGCVLFECLTGAPPFRKDTEVATMYAHLEEDVPKASSKRPGISPLLSSVVTKAMAKRPEDRFATAEQMAEALRGQPAMHQATRRRIRVATVAVAAVLAVALIAYAALGGDDRSPSEPPNPSGVLAALPPGTVANVDPQTGAILSKTAGVPISPIFFPHVEWGEGSVWVLSAPALTQIDPGDGSQEAVLAVGGSGAEPVDSLAVGARTVWVGAPPGVIRFNPANGERLPSVRLGSAGETSTREVQVATGEGHAWAVRSDGELTQINQLTARKTASVDLGHTASGIGTGFDAVWVVDDLQGTLTQIDANDLGAIEDFETPGGADAIAVGAGAVWIIDSDAGVVSPFDTALGSFDSPIRVGTDPTDIAVGLGSVWVTNHGDGTISQIDPITRDVVETITIGSSVAALAVDESTSTLWVVVSEARVNLA